MATYEDKPMTLTRFNPNLGTALKFNRDDLQANRVGGITDRQRTAIYSHMLSTIAKGVVVGVIGLGILLLALLLKPNGDGANSSFAVIAALILFIAGLVISVPMPLYAAKLRQDLNAGKVLSTGGKVTISSSPLGTQIAAGGVSFRVSAAAAKSFEADKPYMLYYTPHAHWILSAELGTDSKNKN